MSEEIKIRITATQTMHYDQFIEITKERWEQLKQTPESEMEDGDRSPLSDLIDYKDPTSWDDFEDIEIWAVDEEGKQLKPVDEYYG